MVSLGGEPAKIVLGNDVMTAFTFADGLGNYHFRVFETIQLVVRDGRAFQTLTFLPWDRPAGFGQAVHRIREKSFDGTTESGHVRS